MQVKRVVTAILLAASVGASVLTIEPVTSSGVAIRPFRRLRKTRQTEQEKPRRTRTRSGNVRGQLPSGRRYYNGRYYGNLNNRFYGTQYGYF